MRFNPPGSHRQRTGETVAFNAIVLGAVVVWVSVATAAVQQHVGVLLWSVIG